MTSDEFGKSIAYLKAFYSRWDFDISNPITMAVWYENLKRFSFEEMTQIVKNYCGVNKFGPQSPFDILDAIPKVYTPNEAWEIVLSVIERSWNTQTALNTLMKEYPDLYPHFRGIAIEGVDEDVPPKGQAPHKCYSYEIGRIFKAKYKHYLDSLKIKYVNNQLITGETIDGRILLKLPNCIEFDEL